MARFYSLTVKGDAQGTSVINVFWYRQAGIGTPTDQDLTDILAAWRAQREPAFVAIHTSNYRIIEYSLQGYSDQWVRTPYLPRIETVNVSGSDISAPNPPIVAAILAARVDPREDGRRKRADGTIYTSPVTRGYWAISPISEADVAPDGVFTPWSATTGAWVTLATQTATEIIPTGWAEPIFPVSVSKPLPGEDVRGYGLVKSCHWGKSISSRRSRKLRAVT